MPLGEITKINGEVKDKKSLDQAIADWIQGHTDLIKPWEYIK